VDNLGQTPYRPAIRTDRQMLVDRYVADFYEARTAAVNRYASAITMYTMLRKSASDAPIIGDIARFFRSAMYTVRMTVCPQSGYVCLHISW